MDRNYFLGVFAILLIFIAFIAPAVLYLQISQYSPKEGVTLAAVGTVSLTVLPTCGDGTCETEEDCSSCSADCGVCVILPSTESSSSGGSSGGSRFVAPALRVNFKFDPGVIQEQIVQGSSLKQTINVTNLGIENIDLDLSVSNLEDFVFIGEKKLFVRSGEVEQFDVLISIPVDTEPKVFLGDIKGKVKSVEKSLPIVLRIIEEDALFKLKINISEETKVIGPGETVKASANIFNSLDHLSADFVSSILDRQENVLMDKFDRIELDPGTNNFPLEFKIPNDIEQDYYLFFVNLTYDGVSYVDAVTFRVDSTREVSGFFMEEYVLYAGIIVAIVFLLIILYFIRKYPLKKKILFIKHKKKGKIVQRVSVIQTIKKLGEIKKRSYKKYDYALVEEFFKIIRSFLIQYYSFSNNLTFEEIKNELNQREIKRKQRIISFIDKIAHIPYTYSLIPQKKFIIIINESISILNSYLPKNKLAKPKKNLKKKR